MEATKLSSQAVVDCVVPEEERQSVREMADALGVGEQVNVLAGDYSLPDRSFDSVWLVGRLSSAGVDHSQTLLSLASNALRPSGTLIIIDMLRPTEVWSAWHDPHPYQHDFLLLLSSPSGRTLPIPTLKNLLGDQGFNDMKAHHERNGGLTVVTSVKVV